MSDFHQNGPVTALPGLVERPVAELESKIQRLSVRFPVALVIPMIPQEMDRPALAGILSELLEVGYIDTLVISLNRASHDDYLRAVEYFKPYTGRKVIVWSESESMAQYLAEMEALGLYVGEPGKGRACWLALGYVLAEERVEYVAFLDADIVNFRREMLARLVLPAIDPTVDFDFVKAYYARVSDRLHGRVTRLLLSPLLAAFTRLLGGDPYIRYLASFRYALSGEFVVKSDLAVRMRLPCDWGLEIVTLFEALRHRAPVRLCQVELAERYDHKHQELSAADPTRGLHRMAKDVVKHLLRSLLAAYQREAEDAVADSYAVAVMNGLVHDRHEEELNVQTFTIALRASIEEFLADPLGAPLVPNWSRVWAGMPDAGPRLLEAVQQGPAVTAKGGA